jgi:hypothetical protein
MPAFYKLMAFFGAMLLAIIACGIMEPVYTPSLPQATAGALNETYQAAATQTALPSATSTATATPTDTPTITLTWSIIEVTCDAYICEMPN